MTRKTYCGNILWQSGLTLLAPDFFIEIAKLKPGLAFFRDDAFADDSSRTNLQQVFNQFSPTTSIKVI